MDNQPHVSPLRYAVKACLRYDVPWTWERLVELAGVAPTAAKRYCTQLVRSEVLRRQDDGRLVAGPRAGEYRREVPKTHVGGNANQYKVAREVRMQLEEREIEAILNAGPGDLTSAGSGHQVTFETIMVPLVTDPPERGVRPRDAADRLGVSPRTIRRWLEEGRIKGFRLPSGNMRVLESEIERIINGEAKAG